MIVENPIRAFFAIDLPESINPVIADLIKQLQKLHKHRTVSWVNPEHLHITLQFMAAINDEDVNLILDHVSKNLATAAPFALKLTVLELFPTPYRPHIISINVSPNEKLAELAKRIGQGIVSSGYPIETRPFRGHLTLGRIRDFRTHFELEKIIVPEFPEFLVSKVVLYRSEQDRRGAKYHPLGKISLPATV